MLPCRNLSELNELGLFALIRTLGIYIKVWSSESTLHTRNPANLWLSVWDLKKRFTYLSHAPKQLVKYLLEGG